MWSERFVTQDVPNRLRASRRTAAVHDACCDGIRVPELRYHSFRHHTALLSCSSLDTHLRAAAHAARNPGQRKNELSHRHRSGSALVRIPYMQQPASLRRSYYAVAERYNTAASELQAAEHCMRNALIRGAHDEENDDGNPALQDKDNVNSSVNLQGTVNIAAVQLAPEAASSVSCAVPTSSFRSQLHPPGGLTIWYPTIVCPAAHSIRGNQVPYHTTTCTSRISVMTAQDNGSSGCCVRAGDTMGALRT